ncbi:Slp family lipoprotein [Nissabacter sp. SGAir0207]|uniref:Slp family lipoprotein n=1 Tax=Nissabacter sp. SGAir0207 TaxID=2126321 RepID=UPI0010CD1360|nr:Slp family lipoprotein [Nissabacter sp. SGAir0207]QCR35980.1 hypothetical protein C1N62_07715 [Nissabacter sp. SGAir0207]
MHKPLINHPLRVALFGLTALALSGCVSVPDEIKGTTPTPQQNLAAVQNAPQLYVGQEARFGGSVVSMDNEPRRTRLEIAAVPLDSAARPILGERSTGRVVAYINGFVDPVDLRGQLVTVVGPITGSERGKIGQTDYTFVVMNANSYKRWRLQQQVVMPPGPTGPWGWGPGWGGPGWGPGFYGGGGWYSPQPAQVQTVVTE